MHNYVNICENIKESSVGYQYWLNSKSEQSELIVSTEEAKNGSDVGMLRTTPFIVKCYHGLTGNTIDKAKRLRNRGDYVGAEKILDKIYDGSFDCESFILYGGVKSILNRSFDLRDYDGLESKIEEFAEDTKEYKKYYESSTIYALQARILEHNEDVEAFESYRWAIDRAIKSTKDKGAFSDESKACYHRISLIEGRVIGLAKSYFEKGIIDEEHSQYLVAEFTKKRKAILELCNPGPWIKEIVKKFDDKHTKSAIGENC